MKKSTEKKPLSFPIKLFADKGASALKEIHVIPVGNWDHPVYGPMEISEADISEFVRNFKDKVRKDIPITEGHEGFNGEKPAVGWFKELIDKGTEGLYATVEWTVKGKELLEGEAYKYFSPEFYDELEDPETREVRSNVLVGGALTNKPFFKSLDAVVFAFSEPKIKNQFSNMDLKTILEKEVTALTDEERSFLRENKDELNDEQLEKFGSVFENDEEEKEEEKEEEEKEEEKDEEEEKEEEKEEKPDDEEEKNEEEEKEETPAAASEPKISKDGKVIITASEYKALQSGANKGALAHEKLRASEVRGESDKLVFSESNKDGRVLPKDESKLFSFMLGLTKRQRKTFKELISAIPATNLFGEAGDNVATEGSAQAELDKKVRAFMEKSKTPVQYADALREVLKSNKGLSKRYSEEVASK